MTRESVCSSANCVESSILRIRGKKAIRDRVLARQLDDLQRTYDRQFTIIFRALRQLIKPPVRKRNSIGFRAQIPRKQPRR